MINYFNILDNWKAIENKYPDIFQGGKFRGHGDRN